MPTTHGNEYCCFFGRQLRDPPRVRCHHWKTSRHCLQQSNPKRLIARGEHEDGCRPVVGGDVAHRAAESDCRREIRRSRSFLETSPESSLPHQEENQLWDLLSGAREGVDQKVLTLLKVQPANVQDHHIVLPKTQLLAESLPLQSVQRLLEGD